MGPEVFGDALADALLITHPIHFRGVLGGDQDCVDRDGLVVFIDDAHLGFAIGKQVAQGSVVAHFGKAARQPVGQADRQRHQLGRLVAGVAEHDSLVAGTHQIQRITGVVVGLVNALGDVGGLLVESHQHRTAVGIEATGPGSAVTDLLDHIAHQVDEIHLRFGGHLTGDHAEAGVHHGLAGHAAGGILGKQSIENGVAHLVADLVGMPFRDGLGCKDVSAHSGLQMARLYVAVLRARSSQPWSRCCADGSSGGRLQPPVNPITPPMPASRAI